ncbi:hypothetical protein QJQ45_011751 [Haematococcus lacustris]|nr:hypothetical protein QJQ45_011751 [Haematococcus lacustris]
MDIYPPSYPTPTHQPPGTFPAPSAAGSQPSVLHQLHPFGILLHRRLPPVALSVFSVWLPGGHHALARPVHLGPVQLTRAQLHALGVGHSALLASTVPVKAITTPLPAQTHMPSTSEEAVVPARADEGAPQAGGAPGSVAEPRRPTAPCSSQDWHVAQQPASSGLGQDDVMLCDDDASSSLDRDILRQSRREHRRLFGHQPKQGKGVSGKAAAEQPAAPLNPDAAARTAAMKRPAGTDSVAGSPDDVSAVESATESDDSEFDPDSDADDSDSDADITTEGVFEEQDAEMIDVGSSRAVGSHPKPTSDSLRIQPATQHTMPSRERLSAAVPLPASATACPQGAASNGRLGTSPPPQPPSGLHPFLAYAAWEWAQKAGVLQLRRALAAAGFSLPPPPWAGLQGLWSEGQEPEGRQQGPGAGGDTDMESELPQRWFTAVPVTLSSTLPSPPLPTHTQHPPADPATPLGDLLAPTLTPSCAAPYPAAAPAAPRPASTPGCPGPPTCPSCLAGAIDWAALCQLASGAVPLQQLVDLGKAVLPPDADDPAGEASSSTSCPPPGVAGTPRLAQMSGQLAPLSSLQGRVLMSALYPGLRYIVPRQHPGGQQGAGPAPLPEPAIKQPAATTPDHRSSSAPALHPSTLTQAASRPCPAVTGKQAGVEVTGVVDAGAGQAAERVMGVSAPTFDTVLPPALVPILVYGKGNPYSHKAAVLPWVRPSSQPEPDQEAGQGPEQHQGTQQGQGQGQGQGQQREGLPHETDLGQSSLQAVQGLPQQHVQDQQQQQQQQEQAHQPELGGPSGPGGAGVVEPEVEGGAAPPGVKRQHAALSLRQHLAWWVRLPPTPQQQLPYTPVQLKLSHERRLVNLLQAPDRAPRAHQAPLDPSQPLDLAQLSSSSINKPNQQALLPCLHLLHPLSLRHWAALHTLPCLVRRMEMVAAAQELQDKLRSIAGPGPVLPEVPDLVQALASSSAREAWSLEGAELVGDAVLDYVAAVYLFQLLSDKHEGVLTECKVRLVANEVLLRMTLPANVNPRSLQLPGRNLTEPALPILPYVRARALHALHTLGSGALSDPATANRPLLRVRGKRGADAVEALLGVTFMRAGGGRALLHFAGSGAHELGDGEAQSRPLTRTKRAVGAGEADDRVAHREWRGDALSTGLLHTAALCQAVGILPQGSLQVLAAFHPQAAAPAARLEGRQPSELLASLSSAVSSGSFGLDSLSAATTNRQAAAAAKLVKDMAPLLGGYVFRNPALLVEAMTHCSHPLPPCNQRVEFLGDAVLDLLITSHLVTRSWEAAKEREAEAPVFRAHVVPEPSRTDVPSPRQPGATGAMGASAAPPRAAQTRPGETSQPTRKRLRVSGTCWLNPGQISEWRNLLVSNVLLAEVCARSGLHLHLRAGLKSVRQLKDAYVKGVRSAAGATATDDGLTPSAPLAALLAVRQAINAKDQRKKKRNNTAKSGGVPKLMADLVEAVLGAALLDCGGDLIINAAGKPQSLRKGPSLADDAAQCAPRDIATPCMKSCRACAVLSAHLALQPPQPSCAPPMQLGIFDPQLLAQIKDAMDLLTNACVLEHLMRGPHHRGMRLLPGEVVVFEQPSSAWPVAMLKALDEMHVLGGGNSLNANTTNIITGIEEFYRHPGRFIKWWCKAVGVEGEFSRAMKKQFPQLVLGRLGYSQPNRENKVEAEGVSINVRFVRSQVVKEAVELPFIGRQLTAIGDFSAATHIAVGVDPGVTHAIKATHAVRDLATCQVLRQWEWELTKGQLKHDCGLTKTKHDTTRWSAERGVTVFLRAGCFSQGGWKAGVVREGFCKVVKQPSMPTTFDRPDRLVIVDEFRTSRVSSSVHARQPCELHMPNDRPRPADRVPPTGQVIERLDQPPLAAPDRVPPPQAPPWGRWLDRDTNGCLDFQRIGESMHRPLELCS